jgi:hypothetical protein
MDLAVAHIQAAAMNERLESWFFGDLPDNDQDQALLPAQRNGPRFRNIFIRRTSGETRWERIEKEFTRMTGIPARLVTWEVANEIEDGWPSTFLDAGKATLGYGGKETAHAGPRLPIDSIYMIAGVEGLPVGFRVYALADSFDISYLGFDVLSPTDLLALVDEDLFYGRWRGGDQRKCARCLTRIIKRNGAWIGDTGGDACCDNNNGEEGVHTP